MILGEIVRKRLNLLPFFAALVAAALVVSGVLPGFSQPAVAQEAGESGAVAANIADATLPPAEAAEGTADEVVTEVSGYTPLGPEWIKGQPTNGRVTFQDQYSPNGQYALWMHDAILMPVIAAICLLVLVLLLFVIVRYNRRASAVPSKTSHNTLIEVIWTVVPVLILVVIAIPSITLISRQYQSPPEDALTIKATGYQWYWGYTYPDNGGFEVISNMMDEGEALARGFPPQLEADNRMVVPVGEPIRIQVFGADVIHAFAVPSLWFKMDAVPGRINEKTMQINEPGIYYGQCMELCGARHAYMPIAIEALPRPQFEAWVLEQPGGTLGEPTGGAAPVTARQEPESSVEDAPGAGAPPTEETAPGVPVPAET